MYTLVLLSLSLVVFVADSKHAADYYHQIRPCTAEILALAKTNFRLKDITKGTFVVYYSSYPINGRCAYTTFTTIKRGNNKVTVQRMVGTKDKVLDAQLEIYLGDKGIYSAKGPNYDHKYIHDDPFYSKLVVTDYDDVTGVLSYIHCSDDGSDNSDQRYVLIRSDKLGDSSATLLAMWFNIRDKKKQMDGVLQGNLTFVNPDCSRKH